MTPLLDAEVVDGEDVRVVELGHRLGLALEAGEPLRVLRHLLGQHLDGHIPLEPLVLSPVHHAHSAGADLLDDAVVAECLTNKVCHGCLPVVSSYTGVG